MEESLYSQLKKRPDSHEKGLETCISNGVKRYYQRDNIKGIKCGHCILNIST